MATSDDWDFKWLQEVIEDASRSPKLSNWESKFISDIAERIHRYGAAMMMSQAQIDAVKRIEAKIYGL